VVQKCREHPGASAEDWRSAARIPGLRGQDVHPHAGTITARQFLDLNEKIGGYDQDANYVASRSAGDVSAIKRAYQGGVTLGGGGGLASIPVFDDGAYNDAGGYHYQWFHFAIRERIAKQNGNADNHVMWRNRRGLDQVSRIS
jgi:hypothetical protein